MPIVEMNARVLKATPLVQILFTFKGEIDNEKSFKRHTETNVQPDIVLAL